MIADTRAR